MIGIKTTNNLPLLLENALRKSDIENMGLDLRDIEGGSVSKEEKIKRVAIQFEEVLINTLLKETFKEEEEREGEEEGLPLHTGSLNDLRQMFLSQYIADNGGLGYREIIQQQIKDHYFPSPSPTLMENISNPVPGPISSDYGWRKDPIDGLTRFHTGVDFEIPTNTPVKSFMEGKVTFSGWEKGYGYLVEITHPNGMVSRYGHNGELKVKEGDHVDSGAVIALSGSSGRSTGPHLHFELRKGEFSLNPVKMIDRLNPLNPGLLAKNSV
ncbi:MAG: M23 family metallopeptidase [Candidatus Aminicenantes bacterium]|nr:M23 family metallopeptidase [Candidatus Aminicenantes bacterium]